MKKLVSIGVALALLTMAVVPATAAAYEPPDTFAKIPFAIIQSGFDLVGILLADLAEPLGLPEWIEPLMSPIGEWAGGPLAWTVDMVGWGVTLMGSIVEGIEPLMADYLPEGLDLPDLINRCACALFQGYEAVSANFTSPCP